MQLTYIKTGDYYIPNLAIQESDSPLNIWGMRRKWYLEEHRPALYNRLILQEKLHEHCLEIQKAANARMEQLIPQLAQAAGATEDLKAVDQMKWAGIMNACKNQAEEIIKAELIYN